MVNFNDLYLLAHIFLSNFNGIYLFLYLGYTILEIPNFVALQSMVRFCCIVLWLWGHVEMLIQTHTITHGYTECRRSRWRVDWASERNLYFLVCFNVWDYENFLNLSFHSEMMFMELTSRCFIVVKHLPE